MMKPDTIAKIIRPTGLITILLTYIICAVLVLFVLPLERAEIADSIIDSLLTLTITYTSLYITSRGVEKSIQISRSSNAD